MTSRERHLTTDPVLGNYDPMKVNGDIFGGKIQGRTKISRRDFLKLMGAFAGSAAVIAACGPNASEILRPTIQQTLVPELDGFTYFEIPNNVPPEIAFLSLATRYHYNDLIQISDPLHRDILSTVLLENSKVARGGFYQLQLEAIANENAVGFAICGDSRAWVPRIFPNMPTGVAEVDVFSGKLVSIPVARVGAQPAVFPQGVTLSVFSPHQTADCVTGGCGAWAGIDTLINNPNAINELKNHGVSQLTIDELNRLYLDAQSGGLTDPADWSRVGARMQAEMNVFQYGGQHFTAYGVMGTADDTFTLKGVISNTGIEYPIEDFPKLRAATEYLKSSHAIVKEVAGGQRPVVIGVSASRNYTLTGLLGDPAQRPGIVFKSEVDKLLGLPVSPSEAKRIMGGADYAMSALKNDGFALLIADNAQDMSVLRTTLMTEGINSGGVAAFLQRGGVIIEMIPDNTGRFAGLANVITANDLAVDATKINLARSSSMGIALNIEGSLLGRMEQNATRNLKLGVINEIQFARMQKMFTFLRSPALRTTGTFFKYGFQMAGDYMTIVDVANFVQKDIMGHDIVWTNGNGPENIIWVPNPQIMTSDEKNSILLQYPDLGLNDPASFNLLGGRLDKVIVKQDDLVQAYVGARNAWDTYGPYGTMGPAEPWSKMPSLNDVGKFLVLEIPPVSAVEGSPLKLTTSLFFQPNDENFDGTEIYYDNTNSKQRMMLVDHSTGIPILGDIPGQKTLVAAVDPNNPNATYIFEVSVPKNPNTGEAERQFEFKFLGIMKATDSGISAIPVESDSVFAPRALVS